MPEGTRPRPEGDRTGSENAETPRSKPFDATKKQFDQQKAGKEKKSLLPVNDWNGLSNQKSERNL